MAKAPIAVLKRVREDILKADQLPPIPCNNPSRLVVIDTETTGLHGEGDDEILQLSMIDGDGNILINTYVKPYYRTEWFEAECIHHISYDMIKNAPELHELFPKLKGIFNSCDTVVGYNVYFDLRFLWDRYYDLGYENKNIVDVMRDFAPIYGEYNDYFENYKWQKLVTCAHYYGFDWNSIKEEAHNSLGDCYATLFCYKKMKEERERALRPVL